MTIVIHYNFFIAFILIFLYLFLRILSNTKFNKLDVIKELYLIGLVLSLIFIVYLTIFTPDIANISEKLNLIPFKSILTLLNMGNFNLILSCIIGNIVLYVPLGFFAYYCFEGNCKDALLMCFLITLIVEVIEFVQPTGLSNIDNILLNLIGGFIGLSLSYKFVKKTQLRF